MRHDEFERSNYDGAPTHLYEFSLGDSRWRYAASESDITLNGVTYVSSAIEHEDYSFSGNPDTDEFRINLAASTDVCRLYDGTPPSGSVLVNIRVLHRGSDDAAVVWSGFVKLGRRASAAEFTFTCTSMLATLNRNGLRLFWGRGCPHALYDRSCRVDPADFSTTVQITMLTGTTLTCPGLNALGDDYLSGGFIAFTHESGAPEHRGIESHGGNVITLLGLTDGLSPGDWITVHPGCARTTSACLNKFNNLDNYGGFPHLPAKSPFDGDPVF